MSWFSAAVITVLVSLQVALTLSCPWVFKAASRVWQLYRLFLVKTYQLIFAA